MGPPARRLVGLSFAKGAQSRVARIVLACADERRFEILELTAALAARVEMLVDCAQLLVEARGRAQIS